VATGAFCAAKIVWRHKFEDDRPFRREFEGIQRFEQISREHPSQLALSRIGRNDAGGYFYYVMELADPLENPKSEQADEAGVLRSGLAFRWIRARELGIRTCRTHCALNWSVAG